MDKDKTKIFNELSKELEENPDIFKFLMEVVFSFASVGSFETLGDKNAPRDAKAWALLDLILTYGSSGTIGAVKGTTKGTKALSKISSLSKLDRLKMEKMLKRLG